ncbi:MAG: hypothetical protein HQK49_16615 [Oligoflexia bacterium]|nr:hypothetical protein [Oligoflexia bacterium]
MKKFKFKLENILKLREFEEYKERVKLGKINQQMYGLDEEVKRLNEDMSKVYQAQEQNLKKNIQAKDVYLYEYWIRSLRGHIVELESKKEKLNKEYQEQLKIMLAQRNKVKILENLKERAKIGFKKEKIKEEDSKLDYLISSSHPYTENNNR